MHIHFNKKVDVKRRIETDDEFGTVTTIEKVIHYQLPCYFYSKDRDEIVVNQKISTTTEIIMHCNIVDIIAHDIIIYGNSRYEVSATPENNGRYLVTILRSLD